MVPLQRFQLPIGLDSCCDTSGNSTKINFLLFDPETRRTRRATDPRGTRPATNSQAYRRLDYRAGVVGVVSGAIQILIGAVNRRRGIVAPSKLTKRFPFINWTASRPVPRHRCNLLRGGGGGGGGFARFDFSKYFIRPGKRRRGLGSRRLGRGERRGDGRSNKRVSLVGTRPSPGDKTPVPSPKL